MSKKDRADERWLHTASFLPVNRILLNDETSQLRRDVTTQVFPTVSQHQFDLAVTSVAMLDRMYHRLTDIWSQQHPLLGQNVRVQNLQPMFRAFHRYTVEALNLYQAHVLRPVPLKQLPHIRSPIPNDKRTIVQHHEVEQWIEDAKRKQAVLRNTQTDVERELETLQLEIDELTRRIDEDDVYGGEPGVRYLRHLIRRKQVRVRTLRSLVRSIGSRFAADEKMFNTANDQVQQALRAALNVSLREVAMLRDTVAETPDLFVGQTRKQQIELVTPKRFDLELPRSLLSLYQEVYDLLAESTVRQIVEEELTG